MLIDTHTHLYLSEFDEDGQGTGAVKRAIEAGVGYMIFPNVDLSTIAPMRTLASKFEDRIWMAMGLHPTEVNDSWQHDTQIVMDELTSGHKYVAVGEIGIDLYWDKTYEHQQMLALDRQLAMAASLNLPAIIHCRDGLDQALEVLGAHPDVRAVFHSFGGTVEDVKRIRSVGDYYFGINGVVTFKNCKVRDALAEITTDRLLLETDAPYLAPVPHRGKRNESAYMIHTAAYVAQQLHISIDAVADCTTNNAIQLFALHDIR